MIKELLIVGLIVFPSVATAPTDRHSSDSQCLALNMYHEARGEGTAGMLAVSYVVLNRVNDSRFPNTICEVVKQGPTVEAADGTFYPTKNKCQFSWYCDGKPDEPKNKRVYNKLLDFSRYILYNDTKHIDITDGALFYHAEYVSPSWSKTRQKTAEIGIHIFYR